MMASSPNLDFVRSIYAAWERGDYSSVEWADAEIEFVFAADGPDPVSWMGVDGMREAWRGFLSAWEGFSADAEEYRELDRERVLVVAQFSTRGKTSGLEVGQVRSKGASLLHVRNGKVTRIVLYFHYENALADLGLKE
jgi:ketosteroid isomerase-like protein